MGGGDLNMKKSWHPLLHTNQERVWKQEKAALEERRKLEELKRERDQEREMQELQRIREAAGGKKKQDKLDWMYATPAMGAGPSGADLEDYLLGKKRIDKLLAQDEAQKVSKTDTTGPIALQNANSDRDLASKIREDPMMAIKAQEAAAYQALLKDPARLKAMRAAALAKEGGGEKESKEERRRRKEEKRCRKEEGGSSRRASSRERERERDAHSSGARDRHYEGRNRREERDYESRHRSDDYRRGDDRRDERGYASSRRYDGDRRDASPRRSRERSPPPRRAPARNYDDARSRDQDSRPQTRDYASRPRHYEARGPPPPRDYDARGPPPSREFDARAPLPPRRDYAGPLNGHSAAPAPNAEAVAAEKAAKLAAMQSAAVDLTASRSTYVARIKADEAAEDAREAELRAKLAATRGKTSTDGAASFLLDQQRKVFGMGGKGEEDLESRLKRGREGLQRIRGD